MPNLQLRDYQLDMLSRAEAEFARGQQVVMLSLATGAGKTGLAATWAKRFKRRVLFMAPKLAVIAQAPDEFHKWGGNAIAVGSGLRSWSSAMQQTRYVQTAIACSDRTAFNKLIVTGEEPNALLFDQFDAIIVDEAHHAPHSDKRPKQVSQVIAAAKALGKPVLGITATPWRMSKREGYEPLWDVLILGAEWIDLRGKYLADVDLINSRQTIVGAGDRRGQDYKVGETDKANQGNPIYTTGAFDYIDTHARNEDGSYKKTLMFAVGQIHALNLCKEAKARGIETGLLVSGSEIIDEAPVGIETDRDEVNRGLRSGDLRLVVSVNMVTEGYDLPDVECVIVLRPTMSVALWKQMCGRGSRLSDGKAMLTLIDLTDNTIRLGDPFRKYRWQLAARGEHDLPGEPVMRACRPERGRGCERFLFTAEHVCKKCGAAQGKGCDTCGVFRLWKEYERSSTRCERCVAAEPSHPLLEAAKHQFEVKQIRLRKTKTGSMYIACLLADGRPANFFNAPRAYNLSLRYPELKKGLWVMIDADMQFSVVVQQRGRWLNVTEMTERTQRRQTLEHA